MTSNTKITFGLIHAVLPPVPWESCKRWPSQALLCQGDPVWASGTLFSSYTKRKLVPRTIKKVSFALFFNVPISVLNEWPAGEPSKKVQQVSLQSSGRENVLLYAQEPHAIAVEVREGDDSVFKLNFTLHVAWRNQEHGLYNLHILLIWKCVMARNIHQEGRRQLYCSQKEKVRCQRCPLFTAC